MRWRSGDLSANTCVDPIAWRVALSFPTFSFRIRYKPSMMILVRLFLCFDRAINHGSIRNFCPVPFPDLQPPLFSARENFEDFFPICVNKQISGALNHTESLRLEIIPISFLPPISYPLFFFSRNDSTEMKSENVSSHRFPICLGPSERLSSVLSLLPKNTSLFPHFSPLNFLFSRNRSREHLSPPYALSKALFFQLFHSPLSEFGFLHPD